MTVEHRTHESEWDYAVPDSWPRVRNKQLLAESLAVSQDGDEELLSVSHITGITPRSEKKVTMIEAETLGGYRLVEPGDLVINMMWAWMGHSAFLDTRGSSARHTACTGHGPASKPIPATSTTSTGRTGTSPR